MESDAKHRSLLLRKTRRPVQLPPFLSGTRSSERQPSSDVREQFTPGSSARLSTIAAFPLLSACFKKPSFFVQAVSSSIAGFEIPRLAAGTYLPLSFS